MSQLAFWETTITAMLGVRWGRQLLRKIEQNQQKIGKYILRRLGRSFNHSIAIWTPDIIFFPNEILISERWPKVNATLPLDFSIECFGNYPNHIHQIVIPFQFGLVKIILKFSAHIHNCHIEWHYTTCKTHWIFLIKKYRQLISSK